MTEIRIYYECLEQAEHCIKPIIQEAITSLDHSERSEGIDIKLVKRIRSQTRSFDKYFPNGKNVLRAICSLVTLDIMITGVAHSREIPLAIIEFTEAVTTEDHELQRLYGAVAALLAQTFYIKISGAKQSDREFGGAEYNMYSSPRAFIEKFNYKGFIIAEWPTEEDNPYCLQRLPGLLACPPDIPILRDTIQKSVQAFCQDSSDDTWFQRAVHRLGETSSFHDFMIRIKRGSSFVQLGLAQRLTGSPMLWIQIEAF